MYHHHRRCYSLVYWIVYAHEHTPSDRYLQGVLGEGGFCLVWFGFAMIENILRVKGVHISVYAGWKGLGGI